MDSVSSSITINSAANAEVENRRLIKTVDLSVETLAYEDLIVSLDKEITSLGGYIEQMDTYNGSYHSESTRNANLTIRIPAGKLSDFLDTVTASCNVVRRSDSVEDVTLSYVDLETHKASLEAERDRLLELMESAETMDDILAIEDKLTTVRYNLESMESQLKVMDNQVDYSTVELYIEEVEELTPVAEETVATRISEGFVKSLKEVGTFFKELFIWTIIHLPHLVVWAAVIVTAVLINKKVKKNKKNKKSNTNIKMKE
jgi:hypothetical protein